MDAIWIATVVSGIAAGLYLYVEARKWPILGQLRAKLRRTPAVPISTRSLAGYAVTAPSPRALDELIAKDHGIALREPDTDWHYLHEQALLLEIKTTRELEAIVRKHRKVARILARHLHFKTRLVRGEAVELCMHCEAMSRYGDNWYDKFLGKLRNTSAGRQYAEDLLADYRDAKSYGV